MLLLQTVVQNIHYVLLYIWEIADRSFDPTAGQFQ